MMSKVSAQNNKTAVCCIRYLFDLACFVWEMMSLDYVETEFVTS